MNVEEEHQYNLMREELVEAGRFPNTTRGSSMAPGNPCSAHPVNFHPELPPLRGYTTLTLHSNNGFIKEVSCFEEDIRKYCMLLPGFEGVVFTDSPQEIPIKGALYFRHDEACGYWEMSPSAPAIKKRFLEIEGEK